jgi:hypothetical protein
MLKILYCNTCGTSLENLHNFSSILQKLDFFMYFSFYLSLYYYVLFVATLIIIGIHFNLKMILEIKMI